MQFRQTYHFYLVLVISILFSLKISAQNWEQVSTIDSVQVLSITEHEGNLYVVTLQEVFRSSFNVGNWEKTTTKPATTSHFYTIYSYNGNLYLGTWNSGVFRSTDSGESWTEFNTGLPSGARGIVEFAGIGDSLFVGTDADGIYVLNLNQNVWKAYNAGLFQFGTNSLYASGDILYANLGLYLFTRTNGADSWFNIYVDSTETQRSIFDFAQIGNYLFAGTDNGVYRANLDATNWERKDIDAFSGRDITTLAVNGQRIYAGLLFGGQHWIFYSDDYGDNWEIKAHEFSEIYDMTVYKNYLWSARTDGLWYLNLNGSTDIEEPGENLPNQISLSQNYPNPFNPATKISYSLPLNSFVTLKIYDMLGREIRTLVQDEKQMGYYSVNWEGTDNYGNLVSSGVYIYVLKINNYIFSKKMTLLK